MVTELIHSMVFHCVCNSESIDFTQLVVCNRSSMSFAQKLIHLMHVLHGSYYSQIETYLEFEAQEDLFYADSDWIKSFFEM